MNTEISPTLPGSSRNVYFWISVAILFGCISFGDASAQQLTKGTLVSGRSNSYGLTKQQLRPLMPLIKKQTDNMMKIFTKYDGLIGSSYSMQSINLDIWEDLMRNRQVLFGSPDISFTKPQSAALRSIFLQLEKEIVTMLLDEEVSLWGDELELSQQQMESLYQIAMLDIKRKHSLINVASSSETLSSKLKTVSEQTERSIEKLLLPEQQFTWDKQKRKAREQAVMLGA
ncbi:MAG: hypothetical protein ACJ72Z_08395 [Pyrinomonadaceae bacterium]